MRILPPQADIDKTQWMKVLCVNGVVNEDHCVCRCASPDGYGKWQYADKDLQMHDSRQLMSFERAEHTLKLLKES